MARLARGAAGAGRFEAKVRRRAQGLGDPGRAEEVDLDGVVEQLVEAGPADDPDLGAQLGGSVAERDQHQSLGLLAVLGDEDEAELDEPESDELDEPLDSEEPGDELDESDDEPDDFPDDFPDDVRLSVL